MKRRIEIIILMLIFGSWILWYVISGIAGLSKSEFISVSQNAKNGALCGINVNRAKEVYRVEHWPFNLISIATEHYYFVLSGDSEVPLLIREKSSWYVENFDEDGLALRPVAVVGEIRKYNFDVKSDIRGVISNLSALGVSVSAEKYLSGNYKTLYILRLVSGLLTAAAAVFTVAAARKESVPKWESVCLNVFRKAALTFMAFVLLFGKSV